MQVQVEVQVQVQVEVAAQGSKTAALPVQNSPQRIVLPPKGGGWTSGLGALQYDPQSTARRKYLGAQRGKRLSEFIMCKDRNQIKSISGNGAAAKVKAAAVCSSNHPPATDSQPVTQGSTICLRIHHRFRKSANSACVNKTSAAAYASIGLDTANACHKRLLYRRRAQIALRSGLR